MSKRDHSLHIRTSDTEKQMLERIAEEDGVTVSDALRTLIRKAHSRQQEQEPFEALEDHLAGAYRTAGTLQKVDSHCRARLHLLDQLSVPESARFDDGCRRILKEVIAILDDGAPALDDGAVVKQAELPKP